MRAALAAALLLAAAPAQAQDIARGPAPQAGGDTFVAAPGDLVVSDWITGLEAPWSLVFLPDGRALVSERPGRIRLIEDGRLAPEPVVLVEVARGGEAGLMGLALDPEFPREPYLYVMSTQESGGGRVNRVARFRLEGRRAAFERVVVDGIPGATNHNGGRIAFGPDGLLYIGTGETFRRELAQMPDNLGGKILRVTRDGAPAPGNPRADSPIYTLGHRNVQGLAWHPETRELFAAEHGPSGEDGLRAYDEINVIRAGANYGWPLVVGAPHRPGLVDPLIAWADRTTPPSGMSFWRGALYVATLRSQALVRVRLAHDGGGWRAAVIERLFHDGDRSRYGRLRDAVVGPDGALYVLTNNRDGRGTPREGDDRILRISASN
jgi:quinoprotein glucose dehydrogenase